MRRGVICGQGHNDWEKKYFRANQKLVPKPSV